MNTYPKVSNDLLPCPFCGGEAVDDNSQSTGFVGCVDCGVNFRFQDKQKQIDEWNTRNGIIHTVVSDTYDPNDFLIDDNISEFQD